MDNEPSATPLPLVDANDDSDIPPAPWTPPPPNNRNNNNEDFFKKMVRNALSFHKGRN